MVQFQQSWVKIQWIDQFWRSTEPLPKYKANKGWRHDGRVPWKSFENTSDERPKSELFKFAYYNLNYFVKKFDPVHPPLPWILTAVIGGFSHELTNPTNSQWEERFRRTTIANISNFLNFSHGISR